MRILVKFWSFLTKPYGYGVQRGCRLNRRNDSKMKMKMKMKSKSMRKKSVAILAGLAVAGGVGASAASLGGLNSDNLGADTGDVASCDIDGIDVDYATEFDSETGEYLVSAINLTDIDAACEAQVFSLTVLGDAVEPSTEEIVLLVETGPVAQIGGAQSIPVDATAGLTAESVTGLAMSISGAVAL
jgi:hypothetical protein